MHSDPLRRANHRDCNEPDTPTDIPHFARAWEPSPRVVSSVRRPSPLPDPVLYHEAIESEAIFELDEEQKGGSIETILVVPFGCKRCKYIKQACSRMQPTCVRCRKAGSTCEVLQGGYQRLPGPKCGKPSFHTKQSTGSACKPTNADSSAPLEPTAGRLRVRRMDSGAGPLSHAPPSNSGRPTSESKCSKRPLSPGIDSAPLRKKKKQVNATSRNEKGRCPTVVASKETDTSSSESAADPLAPTVGSTSERSALKWAFVRNPRRRDEKSSPAQKPMDPIPANTPIPRVWANSLGGLLTVFPELAKTPVGFSWFHCDTPVFLLDNNFAQGHWMSSTTLNIDLLWDFSCFDFELEPAIESGTESATQHHSCQPVIHSSERILDHDANMMDLPHSDSSPGIGSLSTCLAISAPEARVTARTPPLDGKQQGGPYASQGTFEYYTRGGSPNLNTTQNDSVSAVRSPASDLGSPLSDPPPSPLHSTLDDSITYQTTTQANFQPRIPVKKPPEVETLLDSHLRTIPLLLWTARCSELMPCNLPPEYAYSCMGLFFISDLRHTVIEHGVPSTADVVQARVCWSLTLQWAPGGEHALFDPDSNPPGDITSDSELLDAARDFSHPWWFVPADPSSQADDTIPYRPRDLRMQFFSFIPLDLLAEFHPSESFPRGWFCKSCGMINIQEFFRHQICRSATCESLRKKGAPQGKADSLPSLRDHYQSSTRIRPTSSIPSAVVSDSISWDDGMQSWIYAVRDGVTLCHVFTGNQECLQEDATALLERIQCEVLLRREDPSSPYFIHTTRLLHSSGESETMVPTGTPDCARIAYYTLCDFVHRYGEMDKPRFGMVRMQAWVNPGSRKGYVLGACKSPVVIHCLGAEVVLKFTPQQGYKEAVEPTVPDKGKGRMGSPLAEPRAGPSRHLEQVAGNQTPTPAHSEGESPIVAEHVDEATAVMDTTRQCRSLEAAGTPGLKTPHLDPEIEMAHDEVIEPKQRCVGKKNKLAKDKTKASLPEISMTLVHGDCVVLSGDNFECQIVRTGTTILVIGLPEEA